MAMMLRTAPIIFERRSGDLISVPPAVHHVPCSLNASELPVDFSRIVLGRPSPDSHVPVKTPTISRRRWHSTRDLQTGPSSTGGGSAWHATTSNNKRQMPAFFMSIPLNVGNSRFHHKLLRSSVRPVCRPHSIYPSHPAVRAPAFR